MASSPTHRLPELPATVALPEARAVHTAGRSPVSGSLRLKTWTSAWTCRKLKPCESALVRCRCARPVSPNQIGLSKRQHVGAQWPTWCIVWTCFGQKHSLSFAPTAFKTASADFCCAISFGVVRALVMAGPAKGRVCRAMQGEASRRSAALPIPFDAHFLPRQQQEKAMKAACRQWSMPLCLRCDGLFALPPDEAETPCYSLACGDVSQ